MKTTKTAVIDTTTIYSSSDNGQMACAEHRILFGRIPWRRMSAADVAWHRAEMAKDGYKVTSLCEICRRAVDAK